MGKSILYHALSKEICIICNTDMLENELRLFKNKECCILSRLILVAPRNTSSTHQCAQLLLPFIIPQAKILDSGWSRVLD